MDNDAFLSPDDECLRWIFAHSADAMVVLHDDGSVPRMNRAALEFPGVDVPELLVRRTDRDLASFFERLRSDGQSCAELRLVHPDGGERLVTLDGTRLGSRSIVVLRDVTERRELEQELQQLRRVDAIGQVTASVVHDFNNVLMVISACIAELVATIRDREKTLTLASEVRLATEIATALVGQLLPRVRRPFPRSRRVNLVEVVGELRPLLQRLVGDKVEISLLLDREVGETTVDREALEHALLNLVANARDAMPNGGRLTIGTCNVSLGEDGIVSENVVTGRRYAALSVSDTGAGMSPEVKDRMFERFFTTKDAGQGTGLGLATVRRFAIQSRGCVSAHSAPGQGTTVVLYLPSAAAPSAEVSTPAPPP